MGKEPSDLSFQKNTGVYINKHIPLPIAFDLKRDTSFDPSSSPRIVTYEQAVINNGSAITTTGGAFNAPVRGIYQFSFNFNNHGASAYNTYIWIRVDEKEVAKLWAYSGHDSASEVVLLALTENQKVDTYLKGGGAYGHSMSDVHFTGHMLFRL
jgi:hypothetical protein